MYILICGIFYGIIMEFVQKNWVPNRSFEIGDIIADTIGCFIAYLYFMKKGRKTYIQKIGPDGNRDRNQN